MQARRLMRARRGQAPGIDSQYWLGPLEVNHVLSPGGGDLSYWHIDANMTASHRTASDDLVLGRNSVNNWNLYARPYTNPAGSRHAINPGQMIVAGADVAVSHDCRVLVDLSLYDTATGWNWVAGRSIEIPMLAGQTLPMPLQYNAPTDRASEYHLEYTIGFLAPLDAAGAMPVAMPAEATLTVRNTGLFIDQLPADGLFGATSPGVSWQGVPNASPTVRRVATPRTHFTPPSPTALIAGVTYATAQVATPPEAFTTTSVWNRPASTLTPIPDSDARMRWLAGKLGNNNRFDTSGQMGTTWGVPTYHADSTSPSYSVTRRAGNTPGSWGDIRIPIGARPADNGDGELTVYDIERGVVWWFWLAEFDGVNWTAQAASIAYLDGNGVAAYLSGGDPRNIDNGHNGKNGHICHWRWSEFAAGEINRVVRIALPNTYGSSQHIWPLYYSDGLSTDAMAIPQGAILRLKPSIDIDTMFAHVPEVGKIMLRQMQNYGVMYVDSGGDNPGFIMEDTYFENGLARWPFRFDPLPGLKIADSGDSGATVYFDVCYPSV